MATVEGLQPMSETVRVSVSMSKEEHLNLLKIQAQLQTFLGKAVCISEIVRTSVEYFGVSIKGGE